MSIEDVSRLEKLEAQNRQLRSTIATLKWRESELRCGYVAARELLNGSGL